MSETIQATGQCLCGSVKFSASEVSKNIGACHCTSCQRWGGAALLAVDCGQQVAFDDESQISVFDSSAWAVRGFCAKCGSHLYYRLRGDGKYIMPVGLFDADDDNGQKSFVLDHQIFIDAKPHYYTFADQTHNLTGAEVFAQVESDDL